MNCRDNLRILIVTTSFPWSKSAVSGIFVKRLADELAKILDIRVLLPCGLRPLEQKSCNYPVTCFSYGPRSWQRLAHEPGGIPVTLKRQPLLWLLVPVFLSTMFLAVLRAGRQADVIHANWAITGLVSGLAGKLLRKPAVTTLRGADVAELEKSVFNRSIFRLILCFNAKLIAVSLPMQQALHRLFPKQAQRIVHIPNGVDEILLRLPVASPEGGRLRLVSIGSLIPRKDNATIIRALERVSDAITLTVIGDGPEREMLEKQVREIALSDRVRFAGACPPDRISEILEKQDVLVLASHAEGRPNVVIEAMAAGRAVVASRLPGVQELIDHQHNGLLFDTGNVEDIANLIEGLAGNASRVTELGQAARQTIIDHGLSWSACAEGYKKVYEQARMRC